MSTPADRVQYRQYLTAAIRAMDAATVDLADARDKLFGVGGNAKLIDDLIQTKVALSQVIRNARARLAELDQEGST